MAIIKKITDKQYCKIPMSVLRNSDLSLKELGLYCKLHSYPEKWNFSLAGTAKTLADGIGSINSALKSLTDQGLVEIVKARNEIGRFAGEDLILRTPAGKGKSPPEIKKMKTDLPEDENPYTEKPYTVKTISETSQMEKTATENRPQYYNNDIRNKEYKNKELYNSASNTEKDRSISRKKTNRFNQFEQRPYDRGKIEQIEEAQRMEWEKKERELLDFSSGLCPDPSSPEAGKGT